MPGSEINLQQILLWNDDAVLAVNKPPGLRTITDGYDPTLPHLSNMLQAAYGRVWTVHRLDKDTSGVILFARTPESHRALSLQFEQRETKKEYHALIVGYPEWEEINLSLPLRVNGDRRHRTVIDHQTGKSAETDLKVLRRFGGFVLISALPHSGYTHQIRAHLAAVGLPILGDPLYQTLMPETSLQTEARAAAQALPATRTMLHARQLSFVHPVTGEQVTITAPYAADFEETLMQLSARYGGDSVTPF